MYTLFCLLPKKPLFVAMNTEIYSTKTKLKFDLLHFSHKDYFFNSS